MPRPRPVLAASAAVAFALFAAPLAAQQAGRYALEGSDVAIYNLVGTLRATAGTGRDVIVQVTPAGTDGSQLRVETGRIGRSQTLRVIYPSDRIVYGDDQNGRWRTEIRVDDDGTFFDGDDDGRRVRISGSGSGLEAHADLAITVPPGKRIALYLAAGDVNVENVNGEIFVDVGGADVTATGTRGTLTLDTGSGEVRVSDAEGDVTLDAGSGSATFAGVRGGRFLADVGSGSVTGSDIAVQRLDVDAGSGSVRFDRVSATDVSLDLGSGGTDLQLISDVASLVVDAGSGGVTLRLPESLGAEIEVDAGSGGMDVQLPIEMRRFSRSSLSGRIGDGRGRITIDAGSGRVRLLRN